MAYTETSKIANEDNQVINPATAEQLEILRTLLVLLRPLSIITSGTNRISLDVNTLGSGTVSVNSLPVLNISSIGGLSGFEFQFLTAQQAYATAVRPKITF